VIRFVTAERSKWLAFYNGLREAGENLDLLRPGDIVSVDWAGLAFLNLANVASHPLTARLTIGAVDGVAGFRRLVADGPSGGREFSGSSMG
jgi:hypothetical protein